MVLEGAKLAPRAAADPPLCSYTHMHAQPSSDPAPSTSNKHPRNPHHRRPICLHCLSATPRRRSRRAALPGPAHSPRTRTWHRRRPRRQRLHRHMSPRRHQRQRSHLTKQRRCFSLTTESSTEGNSNCRGQLLPEADRGHFERRCGVLAVTRGDGRARIVDPQTDEGARGWGGINNLIYVSRKSRLSKPSIAASCDPCS